MFAYMSKGAIVPQIRVPDLLTGREALNVGSFQQLIKSDIFKALFIPLI